VQQRKVNQCQRPLDSSTGSNLVDMGWRSAGWATSYRSSARPRPQSDGLDEAACMLRMMHGEVQGYSWAPPPSAEVSERGNRNRVVLREDEDAHIVGVRRGCGAESS